MSNVPQEVINPLTIQSRPDGYALADEIRPVLPAEFDDLSPEARLEHLWRQQNALKMARNLVDLEGSRRRRAQIIRKLSADAQQLDERLQGEAAAPLPAHRIEHIEARRDEYYTMMEREQMLVLQIDKEIALYAQIINEG